MRSRAVAAAIGIVLTGQQALSQEIRGTVRDSATRQPVSGAVVTLLGGSNNVLARIIATDRGAYHLPQTSAGRRLRVQRLGFRFREIDLPAPVPEPFDIAMIALPSILEPVQVTANSRCPATSDRADAFALLQQARAALLTTVVAAQSNPATTLVQLEYQRTMKGTTDEIEEQEVRVDSSRKATASFYAAQTALDFVNRGFVYGGKYFGPDANVLLDDGFADAYCFRIMEPNARRANQIGLGFAPAERRLNRVDIEGALWIDTVARSLKEIEYFYVGRADGMSRVRGNSPDAMGARRQARAGGRTSFREMSNGVVMIDRWSIRPPALGMLDVNERYLRSWLPMLEGGGELASALWPDGTIWNAPLATIRIHSETKDRRPSAGGLIEFVNTDYHAIADSNGDAIIRNVLPGPYKLRVSDPVLARLGILGKVVRTLDGQRDSVVSVTASDTVTTSHFRERCDARAPMEADAKILLLGRVVTAKMASAEKQVVALHDREGTQLFTTRTDGDGIFAFCLAGARRGQAITLRTGGRRAEASADGVLRGAITTVVLKLPP